MMTEAGRLVGIQNKKATFTMTEQEPFLERQSLPFPSPPSPLTAKTKQSEGKSQSPHQAQRVTQLVIA